MYSPHPEEPKTTSDDAHIGSALSSSSRGPQILEGALHTIPPLHTSSTCESLLTSCILVVCPSYSLPADRRMSESLPTYCILLVCPSYCRPTNGCPLDIQTPQVDSGRKLTNTRSLSWRQYRMGAFRLARKDQPTGKGCCNILSC
mmetsp:Transcript_21355/g.48506  ORF Transcript_21355/g.48506 Transcript_21355/m.48506 type:complete len:145 (-) Transcript_21355:366-800(-)